MSQHYFDYTFALPPGRFPQLFASYDAFTGFFSDLWEDEWAETDFEATVIERSPSSFPRQRVHILDGSTRNGWALGAIEKLIEATGLHELSFLTYHAEPDQLLCDPKDGGGWKLWVLEPERSLAARDAIDSVLRWAVAQRGTGMLEHMLDVGSKDVEQALASTWISLSPLDDQRIFSDDEGWTCDYLLAYLRSIRYMLEFAAQKGYSLLHALCWLG